MAYVHQKFAHVKRRSNAFDALPVPVLSPRFVQAANVQDNSNDDMQPHNEHDFLTALPFNPVNPFETSKVHLSTPTVTHDVTASIHSSTFASEPHATTSSLRKSISGQAPASSTASAKFASSSASPATSNSSSGAIAGGVVVGLIGFAVLVCVSVYLMRRSQRHRAGQFDANEFRRSAVLMPDLPTHEDVINRGFHSLSPFMAERKPPTLLVQTYYGNDCSVPGPSTSNHSERYDNATNPIATPVPPSPSSYATAGHSQPGNQPSVPSSFMTKQQCRPPSSRRASRPASGNDPGAANGFIFPRRQPPSLRIVTAESKLVIEQVPPNDYVDLSRSSVSPFQAAQHGESPIAIDHHDNEIATSSPTGTVDDPTSPPKSPLEDGRRLQHKNSIRESTSSGQSLTRSQTPELQDFPVPPSPAPTATSHYRISMPPVFPESMVHSRIDSLPPVLPELNLGSRNSQLYERPLSNSFVKRKSLMAKHKSSPLASSGIVAEAAHGLDAEVAVSLQVPAISEPETPKRPETVYDSKDAYGGIRTA
ncbi:hypothetical protein APHAL10511_003989 [Amanita phalloides]|nr:hypothetical protein APHAL10511_003989 [Amanita phalloides]